jgi:hypothetical protein
MKGIGGQVDAAGTIVLAHVLRQEARFLAERRGFSFCSRAANAVRSG